MTFDTTSMNTNPNDTGHTMLTDNCAFTATSRNRLAIMSIDGPRASSPNSVTVTAAFPDIASELFETVDSQFDIHASC